MSAMQRVRVAVAGTVVAVVALLAPKGMWGDAYGDLMKVQVAFRNAKSWQAVEHLPNGRTTVVEYAAPDRWRIKESPTVTELVIGNNIYMVRKGHVSKLPFGGFIVRKMVRHVEFSVEKGVRQTARDLGTQRLNGQSVHVYSFVAHGTPATLYVGAGWLPVESVIKSKKKITTIDYSKYNEPISISLP